MATAFEETLRSDLTQAMKAREPVRASAIRALISALKNRSIEKKGEDLDDADIMAVIKREVKQCKETLEFARDGDRTEAVAEQEALLEALSVYLPQQLGENELRAAIQDIIESTGAANVGAVMKVLNEKHSGQYDGKTASRLAQELTR